jgi:uncharacterized protein involved in copper resistance
MLTLMTAALAAAQPAPATNPHAQHAPMSQGQMAPMQHQQHEAMKGGCECCKSMGKGGHDQHAPDARPQGRRGR